MGTDSHVVSSLQKYYTVTSLGDTASLLICTELI